MTGAVGANIRSDLFRRRRNIATPSSKTLQVFVIGELGVSGCGGSDVVWVSFGSAGNSKLPRRKRRGFQNLNT